MKELILETMVSFDHNTCKKESFSKKVAENKTADGKLTTELAKINN